MTRLRTLQRLSQFSLQDIRKEIVNGQDLPWVDGIYSILQRVSCEFTCLDPPPLWMMLVVNKENRLYGAKYVEFFPRIKQRVVFCLCEANGGFSTEFTKYNLVIHVLSRWQIKSSVENFLHWIIWLSMDERLCLISFLGDLIQAWSNSGQRPRTSDTQLIPITNHCVALNSTKVAFYFYKTNRENLLHTQYIENSNYFLRTKNMTSSVHLAFNYKLVYCFFFTTICGFHMIFLLILFKFYL